jgi:hypothetical protein
MQLDSRELGFIEQEMEEIKDDKGRHSEERHLAAELLGKARGEIEWEKEIEYND